VSGYRANVAKCPGCSTLMDERRVLDAMVDVCPTCHGLWIDWFDGDLAHLTREAGSPAVYSPASRSPKVGACPRCGVQLDAERLSVVVAEHAGPTPPPPPASPEVWRCADCVGAFVPRASAELIIALQLATAKEAPRPPGLLDKLLAVIKSIVRGPEIKG
jgi:Zn-finger nucleic acid-binding protein